MICWSSPLRSSANALYLEYEKSRGKTWTHNPVLLTLISDNGIIILPVTQDQNLVSSSTSLALPLHLTYSIRWNPLCNVIPLLPPLGPFPWPHVGEALVSCLSDLFCCTQSWCCCLKHTSNNASVLCIQSPPMRTSCKTIVQPHNQETKIDTIHLCTNLSDSQLPA